MQRFNDYTLGRPRYPRQPRNHEIRIPVRSNGHGRRQAPERPSEQRADVAQQRRQAEKATAENATTTSRQEKIERLEAEAAEWKEKYMRLYAERENERKRLSKSYANQAELEKEQVLRDMLPLADNLERALNHVDTRGESLQTGVELTLKAFANALSKHGVERIAAVEQPFDPALHEAVGVMPHPTLTPGTVARVEEVGYTINGKLLRPARVLVVAE
jgi:molecular chaperone GrpE